MAAGELRCLRLLPRRKLNFQVGPGPAQQNFLLTVLAIVGHTAFDQELCHCY